VRRRDVHDASDADDWERWAKRGPQGAHEQQRARVQRPAAESAALMDWQHSVDILEMNSCVPRDYTVDREFAELRAKCCQFARCEIWRNFEQQGRSASRAAGHALAFSVKGLKNGGES